ncbi:unnamed protein product [Rangifer tarandus platyrhynchus]|uniref:Uncharacterized protein n=1 Tax=Rangifer tarandus platyrhynchus TaxID=3082113 RepID=A0AC59Y417_RANTA
MPGHGAELAPAPTTITASAGPLSPGPGPGPLSVSCLLSALIASGAKALVVHRQPPRLPSRGLVHFRLSGNPLL